LIGRSSIIKLNSCKESETIMAVNPTTIFEDTFNAFRSKINSNVTDPSSRGSQWIFSAFPDEDIREDKIKYPIIIIDPVAVNSQSKLTLTKKNIPMTITITVYSAKMQEADQLLQQIVSVIDSKLCDFKYSDGLNFVMLEDTDTDFVTHGSRSIHLRSASYGCIFAYTSGISRITRPQTLTSDAVII